MFLILILDFVLGYIYSHLYYQIHVSLYIIKIVLIVAVLDCYAACHFIKLHVLLILPNNVIWFSLLGVLTDAVIVSLDL